MENKRGTSITLASNMEKLFERIIINNRLVNYLDFIEGQAGGRKERFNYRLILKTLMRQRKEGKRLYSVPRDRKSICQDMARISITYNME